MLKTPLNIVEVETRQFLISNDGLNKISTLLMEEFHIGLSKLTYTTATLKMLPTYVRDVPDGTEHGKFLALDLGGTNFRVLAIDLKPYSAEIESTSQIFQIPDEIMVGPGDGLFAHIAECLAAFLKAKKLQDSKLPLGFTFSFPCVQEGLTKARLVEWTKGFKCSGVVGEDIVVLLLNAIDKRDDIQIDVVAVLNDTTGTLMSCAHKNRNCRVGLIIGTGTNACYMEQLEYVEVWPENDDSQPRQVVVNTEWGAFGDNQCLEFIRTRFDYDIDENSINPGKQTFEKMVSGMYLGEIARRVIVYFIQHKLLLNGVVTKKFDTPYSFETQFLSQIELDVQRHHHPKHHETKKVLTLMDVTEISDEDAEIVKLICSRVATRSAFLVSSAISTLLKKMKRPHTTIGVDGTVYRLHPSYKSIMEKKIKELTPPEYEFELMLSEDGSGRGAALVAAVAARSEK